MKQKIFLFFQDYYKKLILIALLIPIAWLFNQMEFPKIDAFIRDSLQYLNSTKNVTKEIVTVNIEATPENPKPFKFEYIKKIIDKLEEQKPKSIVLLMDIHEITPLNEEKEKIYLYFLSKNNLFINKETNNSGFSSDEIFKKYPRFIEFDTTKDSLIGPMDRKHRRAMLKYTNRGASIVFNSLQSIGITFHNADFFTHSFELLETEQVYFKSYPPEVFQNKKNTSDTSIQNKVFLIGTFDEWATLSSYSVFDVLGTQKNNFAFNYYPYATSIANLLNLFITGDYIKYIGMFNNTYLVVLFLIILIFSGSNFKNKIYIFFASIPFILVLIALTYLINSYYLDFSKSIAMLLFLQYFATPLILIFWFREEERNNLVAINNARIDSFLLLSEKIAHDIRSPLSAINLILSKVTVDNEDYKNILQNSLKRIDDIAGNILNKYKTNLGVNYEKFESFSLASLTLNIINEKKLLNTKIRYDVSIPNTDLFIVKGYQLELERILSNVIDNSVQALEKTNSPNIKISISSSYGFTNLAIEDNGAGISNKILTALGSERVSTKKSSLSGNGIALLHAKSSLKLMGGSIVIQSEEGEGTLVNIRLKST